MKDFLEDGNLWPGIHSYTVENFEKQFIEEFPSSNTRKQLYSNFKEWLEKLTEIQQPDRIWLDGSYLTRKINPNDIDLVVFFRPENIGSKEKAAKISNLVNNVSRQYDCDAYLCLDVEHINSNNMNPQLQQDSIMIKYWMGQFTFDRKRNPKGLAEFNMTEISKFIGGV